MIYLAWSSNILSGVSQSLFVIVQNRIKMSSDFLNNLFVEIESNLFRENTKVRYLNRKNRQGSCTRKIMQRMIAINYTQGQAKIF